MNVVIWNEFIHEKTNPEVAKIYPNGIHQTIADAMTSLLPNAEISTATLEEPEHGLPESKLENTDVLVWWGHCAHNKVDDKIAERVQARVLQGMGLIVLHSGHFAKVFKRLLGTSCALRWRAKGERERIWACNPGHPIAAGIGDKGYIEIPREEMYGEPFGIPNPDEVVFVSWFEGGEVFRSGCCWQRGSGRIFYFRPGHETFPALHQEDVQQVIANGIQWAAPRGSWPGVMSCTNPEPIEPISSHSSS